MLIKGWYYDHDGPNRFVEGWVRSDGAGSVEVSTSGVAMPSDPDLKGILLPPLPNAHTHLGDFLLREHVRPGMTVEELVAPPEGLKHRYLPSIDVEESISRALVRLRKAGTGPFCDFREGGVRGLEQMARALISYGKGLTPTILGRPRDLEYRPEEISDIISRCDGLGISGIGDWEETALREMARHLGREGSLLALHASEVEREDIDLILDLDPDFLVHMTKGTSEDFNRLSALDIPVVICPRSNRYYGRTPPVSEMLRAGLRVCIGTDNAMMSDLSILNEIRAIRKEGLAAPECWGLIEESWKLLNREEDMHVDTSGTGWILIEAMTDDPLELLTGSVDTPGIRRPFTGGGSSNED